MKHRIALLSGCLALVAGAAAAIPTTDKAPTTEPAPLFSTWNESITADAPLPAVPTESMELAVTGPCGCIPRPGCPFPFPWPPTWPPGGPVFDPFPLPTPDWLF